MAKEALFARIIWFGLALSIALFGGVPGPPAWAQNGDTDPTPPTILIVGQSLVPRQRARAEASVEALRRALDDHEIQALVEERYLEPNAEAPQDPVGQEVPIAIRMLPCPVSAACLLAEFRVHKQSSDALFAEPVDPTSAFVISGRNQGDSLQAPFFTESVLGLLSYATGDFAGALRFFGQAESQASELEAAYSRPALTFYRALCLRNLHDYPAALDILRAMREEIVEGVDHRGDMLRILDAYIADSLAQNFAFEEALAWDDRNILLAGLDHDPSDPLTDQLLAELYLLRGQHRLYLYEWDAVLDDYNTALGFAHAPARVYYYRGLLYYTQGTDLDAAYEDFARYLELEADRASPLVALAERYIATLHRTPATDSP